LDFGPEEIEFITEREGMALSEVINTLRSLSENVGKLTVEFKTFKWAVWVLSIAVVIGMSVLGVVVALK